MRFLDEIVVSVASGNGGDGCVSFRREAHVPRGGPAGGDGGWGGTLVFEATRARNTLIDFRRNKVYRAPNGQPGGTMDKTGAAGKDLVLPVPVGTMIFETETGELVADLAAEGARHEIIGGKGGKGNSRFKSATRRTPRKATLGHPGTETQVRLELKLIADIGLLGFPNAGKSTLISVVSAARPKVAAYPFTTLTPNLGVVSMGEGDSFVIADIPGLVEGAADGVGLGHQFLRHIERCKLYLHLIAPESPEGSPAQRWLALNRELVQYNPELAKRPQIVVLTKTDLLSEEQTAEIVTALKDVGCRQVWTISSATREGVRPLMGAIWRVLQT